MAQSNNHFLGHVYVFVATLLISSAFLSADSLKNVANPLSLTLLRFLIALAICILLQIRTPNLFKRVWAIMPKTMILGFMYTNFFLVQFYALRYTDVVHMSAVATLQPLASSILTWIVFREVLKKSRFLVYLIAMAGALAVIFNGSLSDLMLFRLNWGDFLFFLGVLSMALYTIFIKVFNTGEKVMVFTIGIIGASCVWLAGAMLVTGTGTQWGELTGKDWFNVLWLSIATTVITLNLMQKSVLILGPTPVLSYTYLTPALTTIMALIFVGGVEINFGVMAGIVVTFLATFLLQMKRLNA